MAGHSYGPGQDGHGERRGYQEPQGQRRRAVRAQDYFVAAHEERRQGIWVVHRRGLLRHQGFKGKVRALHHKLRLYVLHRLAMRN
jgi:hypothetical protein